MRKSSKGEGREVGRGENEGRSNSLAAGMIFPTQNERRVPKGSTHVHTWSVCRQVDSRESGV